MEGLRDTLATDILVYTLETVQNIINAPGDNSIILKTMMLKHFCDNLEERIKQIDLVYCPSSNTFHGIIGVNANDASITINENHRYKHENVRETILNVGEEMGMRRNENHQCLHSRSLCPSSVLPPRPRRHPCS